MKTCSDCKKSKGDDEFYMSKNKEDGHETWDRKCKPCRIIYNGEWRKRKKELEKKKREKEKGKISDYHSLDSSSSDLIDALVRKLTILEDKVAKQEIMITNTNDNLKTMSDILDISD
jgi:hypothetical protein